MKAFYIILLALLIIGSASGQSPESRSLIQVYDSIYYWQWDTLTNEWRYDHKIMAMFYDANDNLTGEMNQTWNEGTWSNEWKKSYSYDANGNLASELLQKWNGDDWVNYSLITYTYDISNNLINEVYQDWNTTKWVNTRQYIYTYDTNNNLAERLFQVSVNNTWKNSNRITYTYDTNNSMTFVLSQNWVAGWWVDIQGSSYSYDKDNDLISIMSENYASGYPPLRWILTTFVYDPGKNLILKHILVLYDDSDSWEDAQMFAYSYDDNNNLTSKIGLNWGWDKWEYFYLGTYTYGDNNFLTGESSVYWNEDGLLEYGDSTHYYFHEVLGVNDQVISAGSISLYPNPSSTTINVRFSNPINGNNTFLAIYDIKGQQLISGRVTEQQTAIDISALPQGIYFLKVTDERTVQTGKFVKN